MIYMQFGLIILVLASCSVIKNDDDLELKDGMVENPSSSNRPSPSGQSSSSNQSLSNDQSPSTNQSSSTDPSSYSDQPSSTSSILKEEEISEVDTFVCEFNLMACKNLGTYWRDGDPARKYLAECDSTTLEELMMELPSSKIQLNFHYSTAGGLDGYVTDTGLDSTIINEEKRTINLYLTQTLNGDVTDYATSVCLTSGKYIDFNVSPIIKINQIPRPF